VTLGGLGAVGPFSFALQRLDASINPSGIQFGISPFLAVPPQTYGTGVQFQMTPGVSVIPAGITPSSSAAPRSTAVARPSHGRNGPRTCPPIARARDAGRAWHRGPSRRRTVCRGPRRTARRSGRCTGLRLPLRSATTDRPAARPGCRRLGADSRGNRSDALRWRRRHGRSTVSSPTLVREAARRSMPTSAVHDLGKRLPVQAPCQTTEDRPR
jgi:hypothetical protein